MSQSYNSHTTRLWKAMGEPKNLKDSDLIRRAASEIRKLKRQLAGKQRGGTKAQLDTAIDRTQEVLKENAILRQALEGIANAPLGPAHFFGFDSARDSAFRTLARVDNPEACP